jgi:hypothetical protein
VSDSGATSADIEVADSPSGVVTSGGTPVLEVVADSPVEDGASSASVTVWVQAVRKTHNAIAASRISRKVTRVWV